MLCSPRPVPRFWLLPKPMRAAFDEERFADAVALMGQDVVALFTLLVSTAGLYDNMELARAAVSYARTTGVLSADDAVLAEAGAYGHAGRPVGQVTTLRRWLADNPEPRDWLRAAWSVHAVGYYAQALGFASCGLRLAARDSDVDERILVGLALTRAVVHAGSAGVEVADLFDAPPPETLDREGRMFISELVPADLPPLPCDLSPGLDDEPFRRAVDLYRRGVLVVSDEDEDCSETPVTGGFFPAHEYRVAVQRWPDLFVDDHASDYLSFYARELHYRVVAGYDVRVVALSVDALEQWLAARRIGYPTRLARDVYIAQHAHLGRRWTGDPDESCWCGSTRRAGACKHRTGGRERSGASLRLLATHRT